MLLYIHKLLVAAILWNALFITKTSTSPAHDIARRYLDQASAWLGDPKLIGRLVPIAEPHAAPPAGEGENGGVGTSGGDGASGGAVGGSGGPEGGAASAGTGIGGPTEVDTGGVGGMGGGDTGGVPNTGQDSDPTGGNTGETTTTADNGAKAGTDGQAENAKPSTEDGEKSTAESEKTTSESTGETAIKPDDGEDSVPSPQSCPIRRRGLFRRADGDCLQFIFKKEDEDGDEHILRLSTYSDGKAYLSIRDDGEWRPWKRGDSDTHVAAVRGRDVRGVKVQIKGESSMFVISPRDDGSGTMLNTQTERVPAFVSGKGKGNAQVYQYANPPAYRQGSGSSYRPPPSRQGSGDSNRAPPSRQGSGDSNRAPPSRQSSGRGGNAADSSSDEGSWTAADELSDRLARAKLDQSKIKTNAERQKAFQEFIKPRMETVAYTHQQSKANFEQQKNIYQANYKTNPISRKGTNTISGGPLKDNRQFFRDLSDPDAGASDSDWEVTETYSRRPGKPKQLTADPIIIAQQNVKDGKVQVLNSSRFKSRDENANTYDPSYPSNPRQKSSPERRAQALPVNQLTAQRLAARIKEANPHAKEPLLGGMRHYAGGSVQNPDTVAAIHDAHKATGRSLQGTAKFSPYSDNPVERDAARALLGRDNLVGLTVDMNQNPHLYADDQRIKYVATTGDTMDRRDGHPAAISAAVERKPGHKRKYKKRGKRSDDTESAGDSTGPIVSDEEFQNATLHNDWEFLYRAWGWLDDDFPWDW